MWLDRNKTTPYELYQYLLNVQDSEVEDLLYRLTFLDDRVIREIVAETNKAPEKRIG